MGVQGEQGTVVVQHFFEVGNHPIVVDGVATESTTKLIVYPAQGHASQRKRCRVQCLVIVLCAAQPVAQQALDAGRMRELGRFAEATVFPVRTVLQLLPGCVEGRGRQAGRRGSFGYLQRAQGGHQ